MDGAGDGNRTRTISCRHHCGQLSPVVTFAWWQLTSVTAARDLRPFLSRYPGRLTGGMFMAGEARLQIAVTDAQASLADLIAAGGLLAGSQEAYGTGTSLAESGPLGWVWGMCRLVTVHALDQPAHRSPVRLALRWDVTGPDGERFPALDADLTLTPAGEHATTLALTGVYRPPPGIQRNGDDEAVVRRVAAATIRAFLNRIAMAICGPARADERDGGITGEDGPWPPADPAP
jgi:hypothetical protein